MQSGVCKIEANTQSWVPCGRI